MEPSISIYSFSLYTALPLMLFFGFYFLFAKTPEKKIVPVAKRNHAKILFICFSCMVSRFWSRFSSQSHNCIP